MLTAVRWVTLILVALGNLAFWLHLFNRTNSIGWPRKQIKRLEKLTILGCILVPAWIGWIDFDWFRRWLWEADPESGAHLVSIGSASTATLAFFGGSLASLVWLAPSWLKARFHLKQTPNSIEHTTVERTNLRQIDRRQVYGKSWVQALGLLPGNQLHVIDSSRHRVRVNRLPSSLDGLRIGHLSDVHLTGFMHFRFYRQAVERLMESEPDLVVLSGDLIDVEECLDQVIPLLEDVKPPLGSYFVLGNHDRRLANVGVLRQLMQRLGWHDLGVASRTIDHRGSLIYLVGNERPWFDDPRRNRDELESATARLRSSLRIGVSHSPDQIPWARQMELDLLFCGHTHGGQVRFPLIGPVVAPSRYGSRFASGWFDCPPTLVHVSRGLSGTHPIRVACPPEVSTIILRAAEGSGA